MKAWLWETRRSGDTRRRAWLAIYALALAGLPAGARAQTAPTEPSAATGLVPEIVVTGSRIRGADVNAISPVSIISSEQIAATGSTTIDAVLTNLPQVVASQNQFSGDGVGFASVNLRGLGTARTLVLVDGRRYVAADASQVVDLNTVPSTLVERLEVVTGGRSAVYGSDAIAGVVNFILKKDFEGLATEAQYGSTEQGDGQDYRANVTFGVNSERIPGNIVVFAEYANRDPVFSESRDYARTALQDTRDGHLVPGGSSAVVGGRLVGLGPSRRFLNDGTLVPYSFASGDFYNYNPPLNLLVPSTRKALVTLGHFQVRPSLEAYFEGQAIDVFSVTQGPPTPAGNTPVTLQVASPFLPASSQSYLAQFDPSASGYVNAGLTRRWAEFGNRLSSYDRRAIRTVTGLRGAAGSQWQFDGYFSYSRSQGQLNNTNLVSRSRLQESLYTGFLDPATAVVSPTPIAGLPGGGQLVCRNAIARASGCVPANVFGADRISDQAIAYLSAQQYRNVSATTSIASLTFTNAELFSIPFGGPVAAALGAEWRRQSADYRPDDVTISGDSLGAGRIAPLSGGYHVKELFAEFNADLLEDRPGVHALKVNTAARWSDYSIARTGSVLSWSGGLAYQPVASLTLRAQFQRATRAPNLNELLAESRRAAVPGVDPCNNATVGSALAALCIATGVPPAQIGTVIDPNTQIQALIGGSPDLSEETSNTWTIGVVFQPTFAPSTRITVDYFDIDIADYISQIGGANILALCYQQGLPEFCSKVTRSPNDGTILQIDDRAANSGGYATAGIDLAVQWAPQGEILGGRVGLDTQLTYLKTRTLTPVAAIPASANVCAGRFGVVCGDPSPKWKGTALAQWNRGGLGLRAQWQYIGTARDDGALGYQVAGETVGSRTYLNLSARYEWTAKIDLSLGVLNVTNTLPPILGDNSDANWANSWPATYETIGRRYFAGINVRY